MEINEDVSVKQKATGRDNFFLIWTRNFILFILLFNHFQVFILSRLCQKADREMAAKMVFPIQLKEVHYKKIT